MKQNKFNVKVILDNRRQKENERFPIKLRITFKGERRYFATAFDATTEECNIINSADAKGKLRTIKNAVAEIEIRAQKCCEGITILLLTDLPMNFLRKE